MMPYPSDLPERVLFEDNHLLAINKRVGEIAQGDRTGDQPLPEALKAWIKERDHKPGNVFMGVVHRLDRPVSGVMLFGKTSKASTRLHEAFRLRKMEKTYWAIVERLPPNTEEHLEHWLRKDSVRNKSKVVKAGSAEAKIARLHYRLRASIDHFHLLEIRLETGRPHQIRTQLAAIGCPIRGDVKYGAPKANSDGGISLHARSLVLEHPVKKEALRLVADVPRDSVWGSMAAAVRGIADSE